MANVQALASLESSAPRAALPKRRMSNVRRYALLMFFCLAQFIGMYLFVLTRHFSLTLSTQTRRAAPRSILRSQSSRRNSASTHLRLCGSSARSALRSRASCYSVGG
jgi:hypothetical protein